MPRRGGTRLSPITHSSAWGSPLSPPLPIMAGDCPPPSPEVVSPRCPHPPLQRDSGMGGGGTTAGGGLAGDIPSAPAVAKNTPPAPVPA